MPRQRHSHQLRAVNSHNRISRPRARGNTPRCSVCMQRHHTASLRLNRRLNASTTTSTIEIMAHELDAARPHTVNDVNAANPETEGCRRRIAIARGTYSTSISSFRFSVRTTVSGQLLHRLPSNQSATHWTVPERRRPRSGQK